MRAHYLQHVPFEGLGSIESWLRSARYELTHTPFFESTDLPAARDVDFVIVIGGPMSVNDETKYPWLVDEKRFIRDCIQTGKPVLGVCLGAQLIASAMGAKVYPNPAKEIGWFPVYAASAENEFGLPSSMDVFHWHGETFDLPHGARLLARSEACENQAFQFGNRVLGLQFHLETTPEAARQLVEHCRGELLPSKYVQSEGEILAAPAERYQTINNLMGQILSRLHGSNATDLAP